MELIESQIKSKIHTIRGKQVMLDQDLAELYGVKVKSLNQAVKRNKNRFPERFMFQLTRKEFENLRSHFVTAKSDFSKKRFMPYAFTEQGVAMLSSVLKSDTAIKVSLQIMDAFIVMRKFLSQNADVFAKIYSIEGKLLQHDEQISTILDQLQNSNLPKKRYLFRGAGFRCP